MRNVYILAVVFHPWMRHARLGERDLSVNALDEGQWYEQPTEFMASVESCDS